MATCIVQTRRRMCCDEDGARADALKNGGGACETFLLDLYSDALSPSALPPEAWKKSAVTVLREAGGAADANNCRPIAITP
eukprot:7594749-Pyramimonas_sp.AAC.1